MGSSDRVCRGQPWFIRVSARVALSLCQREQQPLRSTVAYTAYKHTASWLLKCCWPNVSRRVSFEHFKYLGSLKSADGNCSKDTRARIGLAKKIMLDLVPIWKDRQINKYLKMKLVGPTFAGVDSSHIWC